MSDDLHIDVETRSDVDLKKHGVYRYFATPHADVLMASFKLRGVKGRWRRGDPPPQMIVDHVRAGGLIKAHNAGFERRAWSEVLGPRYGWPVPALEQYRCTAAMAAAMALPRDLGGVGDALGLKVRKDKSGKSLINKFSVPRKPRKGEAPGLYWNEPEDFPDDFEAFHDYCDLDVETEEAADARMVPLSDEEQQVWLLDQRINDRGIRIDLVSAAAAIDLAERAKAVLNAELDELTGGAVKKASEVAKLLEWIDQQGVRLNSAAKAELDDIMAGSALPDQVRKAIEIRQEYAKTSVSKLKAMQNRASEDGRVRGSFIFHGASTGRWVNVGVNFNNLPRPRNIFDDAKPRLETLFRAFRTREPAILPLLYGDALGRPLHLISDAIRGFIWAGPGNDLVQADYTGIEGAVAAWVADEDWKVDALHEIMLDPSLPDMYRRTAAKIMNTTTDVVTKKHPLRQSVGKVSELSLGYQGGVAAFYSMSRNYGVDLDPLYEPVWGNAEEEAREKAVRRYKSELKKGASRTDLLSREAWIACELVKVGWRGQHPAIQGAWKSLEETLREAVSRPGQIVQALAGRVAYVVSHGFLWCRLPSGRCLAYGSPKLRAQVWAKLRLEDEWADAEVMDREDAERLVRLGKAKIEGETSPKVTALGVDSATRKFVRFALYGGLAFQNIVQSIARDLLVNGMLKGEAAGFRTIATVYDEIITEVPRGFGDLAEFERMICELPEWAKTGLRPLPLTAGGWRGKRYRKD